MICILSQSFREHNTEAVMIWLESWGIPCCRLNADDVCGARDGAALELRDGELDFEWNCGGRRQRSRDVKVAWFRRWDRDDVIPIEPKDLLGAERWRIYNGITVHDQLRSEQMAVSVGVFDAFRHVVWLNDPLKSRLNKLNVLGEARRCGIDVPATLVSSDPERIREFGRAYPQVITKCASDIRMYMGEDLRLHMPATTLVDLDTLAEDWPGGFPILVQERLDRSYELRIFYLDGVCTSFAYIHSDSTQHVADGRHSHSRSTPFSLPEALRAALERLMQRLGLDTGSIDMVRTRCGRWVFLEVNPCGQYWSDALVGNEQIDRKIALALARRLHGTRPN